MTTKVRACVLRAAGDPMEVGTIALEDPGPNQVLVRIGASGVCHSDLSVQQGRLPFLFPTVLGHEGAGVVEAVGADVGRVVPGDHVALRWMPPCRRCARCIAGEPMLCEHGLADALGGPYASFDGDALVRGLGVGSFAEATLVHEGAVVKVPTTVPLEQVALVGCALATGVGAVVRTAALPVGASVAVIGCGGVGLAAVQGARLAGAARIVAVDRVPAKLELACRLGATDAVDAASCDPVSAVRDLTDGGTDYVFEVVGRSETIHQAFAMARRGGTAVIVGAGSPDDHVSFTAMELFCDAKTLIGCLYGSVDPDRDFPLLLDLIAQGRLDADALVSGRIGLDDVEDALRAMERGEGVRSLVVL